MKKLTTLLVVVLALVFASTAFAAGVDFSGSLEGKATWAQNGWSNEDETVQKGFSASNELNLEATLNAGGGDQVKAVVKLKPWELETKEIFGGDEYGSLTPKVEVDKAYIESTGAFWNGGPEVVTRIGDLDLSFSPYVARIEEDGISVEGLEVGPVTLGGFYAWDRADINPDPEATEYYNWEARGLNARADIDGISVTGTVVEADQQRAYSVEATTSMIEGIELSGAYAAEDRNNADMYRVNATIKPYDNFTVTAGYRSVDSNFDPIYFERTEDDDEQPTDFVRVNRGLAGFDVGVETTQQGIHMKASYDDPKKEAKLAADTTFEGIALSAATTFTRASGALVHDETTFAAEKQFPLEGMDVIGKYELTVENSGEARTLAHEISAEAAVNMIPQLQGLKLAGGVKLQGEQTDYNASATYDAPNGVSLGAHYDTEDSKGAWVTAGVKVEF